MKRADQPESPRGPVVARLLLRLLLPARHREFVLGDLEEEFAAVRSSGHRWRAGLRYSRLAVASILAAWFRSGARYGPWLLLHDVRTAARSLGRRPGTAAVAIATIAVGIGASAMIYDTTRSLATDAVPFPEPDELVTVGLYVERGSGFAPSSRDVHAWSAETDQLLTLGGYAFRDDFVDDGSRTYRVSGARVTAGFFSALAVDPLLGRTLGAGDTGPESEPVAVITERLWERRLGAHADVIGTPIRINGQIHTIVGVVPDGLQYPSPADLWTPLPPAGDDEAAPRVVVIGRLRPEATTEEAQAALATVQGRLDRERPADERASHVAVRTLSGQPGGGARIALMLIQSTVLVLLLITSTNAAGLILTRTIERRQEIAVRVSLGAGRWRVVRQLLAESSLIAAAAGALGLLLAHLGITWLRTALPASETRSMMGWEQLGLDGHVVAYTLAVAALIALVLGILPAVRAMRGDLTVRLREGAPQATEGRGRGRITRLLLSGEVALALTLLVTAGLITRSVFGLLNADPGFKPDGVLIIEWTLPPGEYQGQEAVTRFQQPLLERLAASPDVRAVGLVSSLPMSRTALRSKPYRHRGSDPDAEPQAAIWRPITPGYLSTVGIDLVRGRPFVPADGTASPRVAIVSEAFTNRHWPEGVRTEPLGQQLEVDDETWTVVGVVKDVYDFGVERAAVPTIYVPQAQSPTTAGFIAIRAAGDPAALAPWVSDKIRAVDPDAALGEIRTLPGLVRDYYAGDRFMALLMAVFASVSLLITVVSLYTLVAHSVARRRHEIGVRLTLGARPRQVVVGAMSRVIVWVGVGIVAGLALAAGTAQALTALLYGVRPLDPVTFLFIPMGLLAIALLATYIPALRASAVDPVETLRGG